MTLECEERATDDAADVACTDGVDAVVQVVAEVQVAAEVQEVAEVQVAAVDGPAAEAELCSELAEGIGPVVPPVMPPAGATLPPGGTEAAAALKASRLSVLCTLTWRVIG